MANHVPHLSEKRRDRIFVLIYLIVVPIMILTIVVVGTLQSKDARNETKQSAAEARAVAMQVCQQTNRRDRILRQIVNFSVSLTRSLNPGLTPDQEQHLDRIEAFARRLRPQDCTP